MLLAVAPFLEGRGESRPSSDATLVPCGMEKAALQLAPAKSACCLRRTRAAHQQSDQEVDDQGRRHRQEKRSDQCRPNHSNKRSPVQIIVHRNMRDSNSRRKRAVQHPVTNFVFRPINRRHKRQDDIVQGHCDRCRDFVTAKQPRCGDRKQCLETPERCESKKDSDGRAECDGMRSIGNRHQRHVMLAQPVLEPRQRIGQSRSVTLLRDWR